VTNMRGDPRDCFVTLFLAMTLVQRLPNARHTGVGRASPFQIFSSLL